jgi:hypothetical protein
MLSRHKVAQNIDLPRFLLYPEAMNPINLYSAPILALLGLLILGFVLLRRGVSRGRVAVLVLIGLALLAGWYFLRPVQTPHEDQASIQGQIGVGTPVLLEFQSPY